MFRSIGQGIPKTISSSSTIYMRYDFSHAFITSEEFSEEADLLEMMESVVEVRQSNIHGRGVFAKRDIKADEFVCIYEGKLLSISTILENRLSQDKEYWLAHPTDPTLILCGYKNPQSKLGVGQLLNDAKRVQLKELDFKNGIKMCEEYVKESIQLPNVAFKPDKEYVRYQEYQER